MRMCSRDASLWTPGAQRYAPMGVSSAGREERNAQDIEKVSGKQ